MHIWLDPMGKGWVPGKTSTFGGLLEPIVTSRVKWGPYKWPNIDIPSVNSYGIFTYIYNIYLHKQTKTHEGIVAYTVSIHGLPIGNQSVDIVSTFVRVFRSQVLNFHPQTLGK